MNKYFTNFVLLQSGLERARMIVVVGCGSRFFFHFLAFFSFSQSFASCDLCLWWTATLNTEHWTVPNTLKRRNYTNEKKIGKVMTAKYWNYFILVRATRLRREKKTVYCSTFTIQLHRKKKLILNANSVSNQSLKNTAFDVVAFCTPVHSNSQLLQFEMVAFFPSLLSELVFFYILYDWRTLWRFHFERMNQITEKQF